MTIDNDDYISQYIQYKSFTEQISFAEAAERSLAHLFHQFSNGGVIVLITGFRSERTLKQNREQNRHLAADLRSLGWGYTPVLGGYLEKVRDESGQEKKVRTTEESYFVFAQGDKITAHVLDLLNRYQQEAAVIKYPHQHQAMLLHANGTTSPLGSWRVDPNLISQFYTRMKKGPPNRQFAFEAAGDDSRSTRLAVVAFLKENHRTSPDVE